MILKKAKNKFSSRKQNPYRKVNIYKKLSQKKRNEITNNDRHSLNKIIL